MIIGTKITLLPFNEKYLAAVHEWINDPEVRAGTGSEGPVSDVEHRRWYERLMADRTQRCFIIGCGQGQAAEPVGLIGLKHICSRSRTAECYLYIGAQNDRRKGLGVEASELLLGHGFEILGLNKIYLHVISTNEPALKLYRKLGFVQDGVARQHLFLGGHFVDMCQFSMLAAEFACRHGRNGGNGCA
jgi:UDP-4-amino-4,6-dideoxy-N-acetyl-beta-L-altrosamine N-acetyltransferase